MQTSFAIGWQATTWLYPSELCNTKTRSTVASLAGSMNWLINSIIVLVADPLIHSIGGWTYIIFCLINLAMMLPIWKYFPEVRAPRSNDGQLRSSGETDEGPDLGGAGPRLCRILRAREGPGQGTSLARVSTVLGLIGPGQLSLSVPKESGEEAHEEVERLTTEARQQAADDDEATERTPLVRK